MQDREWALEIASECIAGWNSHDMQRILSHHGAACRVSSPLIVARTGRVDGCPLQSVRTP